MSLNRALVDRARRVYEQEEFGEWSEGEPSVERKRGPWFRARLQINQPREGTTVVTEGAQMLEGDATLMFGVRTIDGGYLQDAAGNFTGFGSDDWLEVEGPTIGSQVWAVNTGVEPIRTRKRVIGFMVGLSRVEDPTVDGAT